MNRESAGPGWRVGLVRVLGIVVGSVLLLFLFATTQGHAGVLFVLLFAIPIARGKGRPLFLWIPALAFLVLEAVACVLAYHTEGEVRQIGYSMALILNVVALSLLFAGRRRAALVALALPAVFFAVLLIPKQAVLTTRWLRLRAEVRSIVEHVEGVVDRRGIYPQDLDGYEWERPDLKDHITYELDESGKWYQVVHWVVDDHISHWYDSEDGWGYYPD